MGASKLASSFAYYWMKGGDNAAAAIKPAAIKPAGNTITLAKVIDEPIRITKAADEVRLVSGTPVYVAAKTEAAAPQIVYGVEKAADPVADMSRAMQDASGILTTATAKSGGGSKVLGNLGKVAKAAGVGSLGYIAGSALFGGSQVLTPEIPDRGPAGPAPFVEKEDDGAITYITENFDAVNGALGFLQEQIDAIGGFLNDLMNTLFGGGQSGGGSSGSGGGLILTGGDTTGWAASSPSRKIRMIGGAAAVLIGIIYLITKWRKGKSKKGGGKK